MARSLEPTAKATGLGFFQRCPTAPDCPFCGRSSATAGTAPSFDWSFLDGVDCISTATRPARAREAARELPRVGLCRDALFFRSIQDPRSTKRGIWEAHRSVARDARARACKRVLILEDDVLFSRSFSPRTPSSVREALGALPPDWMAFYLGHWPVWAYVVGRRIMRVSALCTHAYVASEGLLEWLCATPYESPGVPRSRVGGQGIDTALAVLPAMYALFPMVAMQRDSPNDHVRLRQPKRRRGLRG